MARALGYLLTGLGIAMLLVATIVASVFLELNNDVDTTMYALSMAIGLLLIPSGMLIVNTWGSEPSSNAGKQPDAPPALRENDQALQRMLRCNR